LSIILVPRVAHVGTYLDSTSPLGASLEGIGLTVSEHPEELMRIRRLRGLPVRWLRRTDKRIGRFVDGHEARTRALAWTQQEGMAVLRTHWQLSYYDAEAKRDQTSTFDTAEEAAAEADRRHLQQSKIRTTDWLYAAGALEERLREANLEVKANSDLLWAEMINRYIIARQIVADGVWYNDYSYRKNITFSRGIILPEHVAEWTSEDKVDRPIRRRVYS